MITLITCRNGYHQIDEHPGLNDWWVIFAAGITVHHIISAYPWPESSLLWLQKTNLEFVWYLPLICVAVLSLTLSQTVEGCYVKRDDLPTDSIQPTRQRYQNKGYCTPPHSPLCGSNCRIYPFENKTTAALFIYWTTRKTHMPCCFSNMSNRYRKRIHISAKIEPSPTYQNHSSRKKVNFFQHCLQLGRQLLSALAFAALLPCTALWTDLWVAAQKEIKQVSKNYTGW